MAPALFLLVNLFLRSQNFWWSSDTNAVNFGYLQAYPSTFAWSMAMLAYAVSERYFRRPKIGHLLVLGLIVWFTLLSHIITGSWLFGILGLRALWELGRGWFRPNSSRATYRPALALLGLLFSAAAMTLAWPYFDVLGYLEFTGMPENPPFGKKPIRELGLLFLFGIPAVLFLASRKKHLFQWAG